MTIMQPPTPTSPITTTTTTTTTTYLSLVPIPWNPRELLFQTNDTSSPYAPPPPSDDSISLYYDSRNKQVIAVKDDSKVQSISFLLNDIDNAEELLDTITNNNENDRGSNGNVYSKDGSSTVKGPAYTRRSISTEEFEAANETIKNRAVADYRSVLGPVIDIGQRGAIRNIRFSPDQTFIAVSRSPKVIDIIDTKTQSSIHQIIRDTRSSDAILGFEWTFKNELMVVNVDAIEFHNFNANKNTFNNTKTMKMSISWYLYCSDHHVLLISNGSATLALFNLKHNNQCFALPPLKLDTNTPPTSASSSTSNFWATSSSGIPYRHITRKQVHLITLYDKVYCAYFDNDVASLYRITRSSVRKEYQLTLDGTGPYSINILENLLIVHNLSQKTTMLFDVKLRPSHPIVLTPCSIQATDQDDVYTDSVIYTTSDFVICPLSSSIYTCQLNLSSLVEHMQSSPLPISTTPIELEITDFLLRREESNSLKARILLLDFIQKRILVCGKKKETIANTVFQQIFTKLCTETLPVTVDQPIMESQQRSGTSSSLFSSMISSKNLLSRAGSAISLFSMRQGSVSVVEDMQQQQVPQPQQQQFPARRRSLFGGFSSRTVANNEPSVQYPPRASSPTWSERSRQSTQSIAYPPTSQYGSMSRQSSVIFAHPLGSSKSGILGMSRMSLTPSAIQTGPRRRSHHRDTKQAEKQENIIMVLKVPQEAMFAGVFKPLSNVKDIQSFVTTCLIFYLTALTTNTQLPIEPYMSELLATLFIEQGRLRDLQHFVRNGIIHESVILGKMILRVVFWNKKSFWWSKVLRMNSGSGSDGFASPGISRSPTKEDEKTFVREIVHDMVQNQEFVKEQDLWEQLAMDIFTKCCAHKDMVELLVARGKLLESVYYAYQHGLLRPPPKSPMLMPMNILEPNAAGLTSPYPVIERFDHILDNNDMDTDFFPGFLPSYFLKPSLQSLRTNGTYADLLTFYNIYKFFEDLGHIARQAGISLAGRDQRIGRVNSLNPSMIASAYQAQSRPLSPPPLVMSPSPILVGGVVFGNGSGLSAAMSPNGNGNGNASESEEDSEYGGVMLDSYIRAFRVLFPNDLKVGA